MKKLNLFVIISVIIITALLSSCTKEGPTGPEGPQGIAGTNGTNGVVNVSTTLITISPINWTNMGGGEFEYGYADSSLTNADVDGIEVFYQEEIYPNAYEPLPCSNFISNGDKLTYIYGTITIDFFYFFASAPTSPMVIKIVVIPPSIMIKYPNTNWKDYSQVSAIINNTTEH